MIKVITLERFEIHVRKCHFGRENDVFRMLMIMEFFVPCSWECVDGGISMGWSGWCGGVCVWCLRGVSVGV